MVRIISDPKKKEGGIGLRRWWRHRDGPKKYLTLSRSRLIILYCDNAWRNAGCKVAASPQSFILPQNVTRSSELHAAYSRLIEHHRTPLLRICDRSMIGSDNFHSLDYCGGIKMRRIKDSPPSTFTSISFLNDLKKKEVFKRIWNSTILTKLWLNESWYSGKGFLFSSSSILNFFHLIKHSLAGNYDTLYIYIKLEKFLRKFITLIVNWYK